MEKIYFTKKGFDNFSEELKLAEKTIKQKAGLLAHYCDVGGDVWHDNFSYEQIVRELRMLTADFDSKREIFECAIIIDDASTAKKPPNTVFIGSKIFVDFDGQEETWEITGYGESDPDSNKISYNSRLGAMFMGKHIGDNFKFQTGSKEIIVKIWGIG